jgi:hypothetical protein
MHQVEKDLEYNRQSLAEIWMSRHQEGFVVRGLLELNKGRKINSILSLYVLS